MNENAIRVGMVIPLAGTSAGMEAALRSLLRQDFPEHRVIFATESENDAAIPLIRALTGEFSHACHVAAGRASRCGQKNHNTLRGIAELSALAGEPDIYVFCDSTHEARPDFLRELTGPIAAGEASFTTGYHAVDAMDDRPVTLAYQLTVDLMRRLQSRPAFTQPWGGAMAMSRAAFEHYGIRELWASNVVDDCSLAGLLATGSGRARFIPGALLRTPAAEHSYARWTAWFDRQILFLKFCMPLQWRLACCAVFLFSAAALGALALPALWLAGVAPGWAAALSFAGMTAAAIRRRRIIPFALNCLLLPASFARSLFSWTLRWHDSIYKIAPGGRVESVRRILERGKTGSIS